MCIRDSIKNCCLNSLVFYNILNCCNQLTCLPCKCTPRFQYQMQTCFFTELFKNSYQMICIITVPCNQMTATHIDPLKFMEKFTEFFFNHIQNFLKGIGV